LERAVVSATWDSVETSPLCTKIINDAGVSVSTVEHVLAALAGCGVHNARIEIDGSEAPILDGSARPFALEILRHGIKSLDAPLSVLRILREVKYQSGRAWAKLSPNPEPWISFHIDFADGAIGVQQKSLTLSNGSFIRELCDSRTFCRNKDIQTMRANGLALGGTLENAVVVDGNTVLSPGGFRHKDEAVRHKMLDALGDLCLAGAPIIGHYTGHCAGHAITNSLLRVLFEDEDAYEWVKCDADLYRILPGVNTSLAELPLVA
jgi:UDP-3-O-[3-hydroxymyristoyl] N-acetylglucosamine deacetylase